MKIGAKYYLRGDKVIWIVIIILSFISLVEVYSSIGKFAYDKEANTIFLFFKHLCVICCTYIATITISRIDYHYFARLSQWGYYISVIALIATFVTYMSFGSSKGAGRWLEIPIIGNFQPSEIAKFILVVYTARMIAKAKDNIKELETFKKLMIPIIVIPALIFPQNFSTASILFVTCFTMLFLGNVNSKHWLRVAGAGLLVSAIAFCIVIYKADNIKEETTEINTTKIDAFRSDTWMQRIIDWRADDKEANTQINTARKAIATGSLTGVMPGNTIQGRLLSESHNDFIYAIIIEELGFIGGISLLFLYSVLFFRCIVIARNCNSTFRSLTVSGLGLLIYLQALINMGVAVGYLPVTGQTLPFISYGGTSYLFTGCAIGMIQSICESFKIEKRALDAAEKNNNEVINNKTINE